LACMVVFAVALRYWSERPFVFPVATLYWYGMGTDMFVKSTPVSFKPAKNW
jgi:hypothetical protein